MINKYVSFLEQWHLCVFEGSIVGFLLCLVPVFGLAQKQQGKVYEAKSEAKSISIRRSNAAPLIIDWLRPDSREVFVTTNEQIDLTAKILAEDSVLATQIKLWINGQLYSGTKGTEVDLFAVQKVSTYQQRLNLPMGEHQLILEVKTNQQSGRSKPLTVRRIAPTQPGGVPLGNLYWVSPDPSLTQARPFSHPQALLSIRCKVLTPLSISAKDLRLFVNGIEKGLSPAARLYPADGGFMLEDQLELDKNQGPNTVLVSLRIGGQIATSETLKVNVVSNKPNLYILSIGTKTNLYYSDRDARDFVQLYRNQAGPGRLFENLIIDSLIDQKANTSEIKGVLEELKLKLENREITENDLMILFISSHGFIVDGDFRIQGDDYTPNRKINTSVSFKQDILNALDALPCKKLIFIDACHSGGAKANSVDINFEIQKLNQVRRGTTTLASCRGDEESYEDSTWANGAFTESIIKGLQQARADANRNGVITVQELFAFLRQDVPVLVQQIKKRNQTPQLINPELGEIPIYITKK